MDSHLVVETLFNRCAALKLFYLAYFSPLGFCPEGDVFGRFPRVWLADEGLSGNWPAAEILFSDNFFSPDLLKFCAKGQSTVCLILPSDTFSQGVLPAYVPRDPLNCAESSQISVSAPFSAVSLAGWELQGVQEPSLSQWSPKVRFLGRIFQQSCRSFYWQEEILTFSAALCVCKGGTRQLEAGVPSSLLFTQEKLREGNLKKKEINIFTTYNFSRVGGCGSWIILQAGGGNITTQQASWRFIR